MTELQPYPENIDGSVSQSHIVEHSIDWSTVAISVAVIVVVLFIRERLMDSSNTNDEGQVNVSP